MKHDQIQRFLFANQPIRLEIIRLNTTYHDIAKHHVYPPLLQELLGKALAATALISAIMKFSGKLTLQVQSEGLVNLLVAQSDQDFNLRGLAKWQGDITEDNIKQAFSDSRLAVTFAPENGGQYQGIVKFNGDNLADSLELYFQQSEQLPTGIYLAADQNSVLGILIQKIPQQNLMEEAGESWQKLWSNLHKLDKKMALTATDEKILASLATDATEAVANKAVKFYCDCTTERMERAIKVLGYEEAQDILKTNKFITVHCEFCNKHHDFDAEDVARIFTVH